MHYKITLMPAGALTPTRAEKPPCEAFTTFNFMYCMLTQFLLPYI